MTQIPLEASQDLSATVLPFVEVDNIELDNLPRPPSPPVNLPLEAPLVGNSTDSSSWHPKITAYRLTFVAVTIGLGTAKAVKASDSAVSVTIEWISGIVILLLAFFFTQYEVKDTAKPYWFFKADLMDGVRTLFRRFAIRIPHYDKEERSLDVLIKPKHPPVTGYRIIVTAAAISFGTTKAMLSYRGQQTAPTTVEWAYGVVVTVILYLLGLYETSSNEVMPWLFTADYSSQVATGGVAIGFTVIHLIGLAGIGWWTSTWGYAVAAVLKSGWGPSPTEPDSPPVTSFDLFFERVFTLMWLVMAILMGIGGGIFVMCWILASWAGIVGPVFLEGIRSVWRPFRRLLARVLLTDLDTDVDEDDNTTLVNYTGSWISHLTRPVQGILDNPSTGLQWCFTIVISIGMAVLYVLAHGVAFIIAFGWTSLWFYGLKSLWSQRMDSWFMVCFTLIWSGGASIAVIIGLVGTLTVVWSFFTLAYFH